MEWEPVIGLEVHAQLLTKSKMFCPCSTAYVDTLPNSHVCPICLGLPGVLPVVNQQAVEFGIMTALALHASVAEYTKFDRKNYPYPDLMKGYQISQYDQPLALKGWLDIIADGQARRAEVTRVHMEEDTAKLAHRLGEDGEPCSLVDVNRSGVPLLEIVGEPDLRSAEEARQYLMKLRSILQYLGVSTGNMQEGSFRCDANVSVRPKGSPELRSKVEVKNMNSFRAVFRALNYEIERQIQVYESGGTVAQETRGWVEEKGITVSQRSKEYAHDYRYFPEPDLPPLMISRQWVEEVRACLPELPDARHARYVEAYGLSSAEASLLTASKSMADYFERCVALGSEGWQRQKLAKAISNWLLGEFSRLLNATDGEISQAKVSPEQLLELVTLVEKSTVSVTLAKTVFEEMFSTGKSAQAIVSEKGLTQISDSDALANVVAGVLQANAQAVADLAAGKQQAMTFLVGQVMKATKGRANPGLVNALLRKALESKGA